jgi:hypothetical protein
VASETTLSDRNPGVSFEHSMMGLSMAPWRYVIAVILALLLIGGAIVFERDLPAAEVDSRSSNQASQFFPRDDGGAIHDRDEVGAMARR